MSEAGDSRTLQRIFLSLIMATICLFFIQPAAFATEKVDQSNLPEWGGGWTHINPDPNGQARMWQTFTPEYENITAVEIDILTVNAGDFNDIITVEIAKDGEILGSTELNVEYGFEGLLRFEFAEAVAVVPGELYELKVHDTGLTRFGWKYAANTYDAGSRYVSASERPGNDWFFRTYATVEPQIIYVDDDAAGANDGTSWENAYVYIQDALADANSTEKPIEIRVAQGIYKPHQSQLPIAEFFWRSTSFELINNVVLKGGYAGINGEDPNAHDIQTYETILSGDLNGDDDPNFANNSENSYHVVTSSGADATTVLDGFTICAGYANGLYPQNYGGGMYNFYSSPTVTNCSFSGNSAEENHGFGGGMYNEHSDPTVTNCIFSDNSASDGGGMYNTESEPIISYCTFRGNIAEQPYGGGGGMSNGNSRPIITNCKFIENSARSGGGVEFNTCYNIPTLTNCIFIKNTASHYGGGIWNIAANMTATNCTFVDNSAERGNALGSFSPDQESPPITESEVTNCILFDGGEEIWNYGGPVVRITYSNILGGKATVNDPEQAIIWGVGNINADPLFVRVGYLNRNGTRGDQSDDFWVDGDYHLKSQAGRWDPVSESWIIDDVTSPCIDAGDPNMPVGDEPEPNGGRINMGAYGGTKEASKSDMSELLQTTQGLIDVLGFKSDE